MKEIDSKKKNKSSNNLSSIDINSDKNKNDASFWIKEIKQLNKELKLKHLLKEKKFSSQEIIQNTLNIGRTLKKKLNKGIYSNKKSNEIIKDLKEKAKTKYISNKTEKNKLNLNEEFKEILDKCNDKTRIKLDKYFDNLITLKNEQTKIIIERHNLEKQIESISNDSIILKQKLKEKNEEINMIIKNFDNYMEIKPFFELIRQFPEKDPKEIMIEFFTSKQNLIDYLNKLNYAKEEFKDITKMRYREQKKQEKFKDNIIEKINEEREIFTNKNLIIEQDILNHEKQLENIKIINNEKMKHKKLLLFLYYEIRKFIPDKKYNLFLKEMGYNPINSEKDFDPSIFSNNAYINLIQECITSKVTNSIEGKLLRNTIVFGNYLARKYLGQNEKNEKYRYNTVETFKNIKLYFDKIKIKNFTSKGKLITLKRQFEELESKRKIMEKSLEQRTIKLLEYLDKLELTKKGKTVNQKIINNNNNYNTNNILIKKNKRKSFSKEKLLLVDDIKNDEIIFEEKKNKDMKKFFLTDVNRVLKRNQTLNKFNNFSSENLKKSKLNKNTLLSPPKHTNFKFKNVTLNFQNLIRLNDYKLSFSKNKDKIYKKNGVKGGFEIYPNLNNLIKQLVEDINFGLSNINNKKNKLKIETNEYFPLKRPHHEKNKIIMKNSKTETNFNKFSPEKNTFNNYEKISNQIIKNIDNNILNTFFTN